MTSTILLRNIISEYLLWVLFIAVTLNLSLPSNAWVHSHTPSIEESTGSNVTLIWLLPFVKVVYVPYVYTVQNVDVQVDRKVSYWYQDAAPAKEDRDRVHVNTNFSPMIWVPVLVMFIVPKNKISTIKVCKWSFGRKNIDGNTIWHKLIVNVTHFKSVFNYVTDPT